MESEEDDDAPDSLPETQELELRLRPELDEALLALDELSQDDPDEALSMFDSLPKPVQALPEFQLLLARSHQTLGQLTAARDLALGVVKHAPDSADAHHLLGDLLEDLEESEQANVHFLRVLALDEEAFQAAPPPNASELGERIETIAMKTIECVRSTAIGFARFDLPRPDEVLAGLDPRALCQLKSDIAPPELIIYLANVDAEFGDLVELGEFDSHLGRALGEELAHNLSLAAEDLKSLNLDQIDD